MNTDKQRSFMYLFEKVGEPLYFGPRGTGSSSVIYNVPMDNLTQRQRHASQKIREGFANMPNLNTIRVNGVRAPDLSNIGTLCPRSTIFSYFIPSHRQAAQRLSTILMAQQSTDDFLAMACTCRDNDQINTDLWIHSVASCCLRRRDMRGFRMPALFEVMPDSFVNPNAIRQAQQMGALPPEDRSIIILDRNFTGQDSNPENRLAYYREDMAINSHHWHWHLIYTLDAMPGQRNRKGELFYYMHHSMMARYDAERLCHNFSRTLPLALDRPIAEGYFPKLTQANSGIIWGSRQENTSLSSVNRPAENLRFELDDLRKWADRIYEAIDTGVIIGRNGERVTLTEATGIDILGDIVENGGSMITPNERFYGDLHNMGHVAIAFAHDPVHRHQERIGVLGDVTTAMRDPAFYRWHRYVDDIFDKYKQTLQPYSQAELVWPDIQLTRVEVQTGSRNPNILVTHWMESDVDLSRGLDFGRTASNGLGPVWARTTHLAHEPFSYRISVTNGGRQAVTGTVRIFMAPRQNEIGQRFAFRDQRLLFFELDKFTTQLQPGQNQITRNSTESSLTIPWAQTFRDLEALSDTPTSTEAVCGCGWPDHMLIPRGSTAGVVFDLYVIITNGAEDMTPRSNPQTEAQRQGCKDAVSYCGILDEVYPDAKPMGFPFDRNGVMPGTTAPLAFLDDFITPNSNMRYAQVRIVHRAEVTLVREGGAPSDLSTINSQGVITNPVTTATTPSNATQRPAPTRPNPGPSSNGGRNPPAPPRNPAPVRTGWNNANPGWGNWG